MKKILGVLSNGKFYELADENYNKFFDEIYRRGFNLKKTPDKVVSLLKKVYGKFDEIILTDNLFNRFLKNKLIDLGYRCRLVKDRECL